ncbi:hypothetical protein KM043_008385 [Ampulex compressa]|nr:hypothetical protein KM043_008385 [Ampulex compressa]
MLMKEEIKGFLQSWEQAGQGYLSTKDYLGLHGQTSYVRRKAANLSVQFKRSVRSERTGHARYCEYQIKIKMTPLTRWVFLVPLLGLAASLPAEIRDDACVWLCHAQDSSEEHGGRGCSHERIVPQSDSDRSQEWRLLCLIPCRETGGDLPVFDGSRDCFELRRALITARECSCWPRKAERRPLDHRFGEYVDLNAITWRGVDWLRSLLEGLQRLKRSGASLKEARAAGSMEVFDWKRVLEGRVEGSSRFRSVLAPNLVVKKDGPPGGPVEVPGVEEVDDMGMEEEEEEEEEVEVDVGNKETHTGTTKDPNSSEEGHIDWEMWCMAQCDNGQGGSACNCDIIP